MVTTNPNADERELLVELFVPGTPAPKGSTKAFVVQRRGRKPRANVVADNARTQRAWHDAVHEDVDQAFAGRMPVDGAVHVHTDFVLPRRKTAPRWWTPPHTRKPDLDKLQRCTWDGLTGIVIVDDARVTSSYGSKREAEPGEQAGCYLRVELLPTPRRATDELGKAA